MDANATSGSGGSADPEESYRAYDQHPDSVVVTDARGITRYVNPVYERRSGYARSSLVGRTPRFLSESDQEPTLVRRIWRAVRSGGVFRGEVPGQHRDGSTYVEELVVAPLVDADGETEGYIATGRDITDRKQRERSARGTGYYDAVTGLATRRLLDEWARRALALARRNQRTVALLLLDLDQFAQINSTFGWEVGDQVLQILGERLEQSLRDSDMLARLEDDTLAVLLHDVPEDETIGRVTERVLAGVRRPCSVGSHTIEVDISIGVALYPRDAGTMGELIDCAAEALEFAKREGTGFEFYQVDFGVYTRQRLRMEEDLRLATDNEEFELHFQPIFAADSGEQVGAEALTRGSVIGVEALARWPHASDGMISPAEFIPIAETTGRILALDRWAVATAVRQAALWYDDGWRGWVSVNLSARSLHDPELSGYVESVLSKRRLDAKHLVIEVTESAAMRDPSATASVLSALKDVGVRIAMDDFGIGHSSLAYLKNFPVDLLKLDGTFVRDVGREDKDDRLIEAIIRLAHEIGALIVAEGVEHEDQLDWLRTRGCDFVQGFLVGRPTPPDEVVPQRAGDSRRPAADSR